MLKMTRSAVKSAGGSKKRHYKRSVAVCRVIIMLKMTLSAVKSAYSHTQGGTKKRHYKRSVAVCRVIRVKMTLGEARKSVIISGV